MRGNHKPFAVVIDRDDLHAAAQGLHHFLVTLRQEAARCISFWNGSSSRWDVPEKIQASLATPWPEDLAQAKAWVAKSEEGESFGEALAFLHAHFLCLEQARERQLAVFYGVWLY